MDESNPMTRDFEFLYKLCKKALRKMHRQYMGVQSISLWLKKVHAYKCYCPTDYSVRNTYMGYLSKCLAEGVAIGPFTGVPPPGRLREIIVYNLKFPSELESNEEVLMKLTDFEELRRRGVSLCPYEYFVEVVVLPKACLGFMCSCNESVLTPTGTLMRCRLEELHNTDPHLRDSGLEMGFNCLCCRHGMMPNDEWRFVDSKETAMQKYCQQQRELKLELEWESVRRESAKIATEVLALSSGSPRSAGSGEENERDSGTSSSRAQLELEWANIRARSDAIAADILALRSESDLIPPTDTRQDTPRPPFFDIPYIDESQTEAAHRRSRNSPNNDQLYSGGNERERASNSHITHSELLRQAFRTDLTPRSPSDGSDGGNELPPEEIRIMRARILGMGPENCSCGHEHVLSSLNILPSPPPEETIRMDAITEEELQLDLDFAEDVEGELHDVNELPGSQEISQRNRSGRAREQVPDSLNIHSPGVHDNLPSPPSEKTNRNYVNPVELQLELDLAEDVEGELHDVNELPGSQRISPANRSGRALEPASLAIRSTGVHANLSSPPIQETYRNFIDPDELRLDLDWVEDMEAESHDSNELPRSQQRRQSNRSGRAHEPASLASIHSPNITDNSSRTFGQTYRIYSNREQRPLDIDLTEDIAEELHDSNELPGSSQISPVNRSSRALEPASLGIHSPDIPDNSSRPFGEANRTYSNTEEFQLDLDLTEDIAEELHDSNEMPGSWQRSPANRSGSAIQRFREANRINSNTEERRLDLDLTEDIAEELHDSNEMPGSWQRSPANRSGRALEPASSAIHSPDIPDNSSRRFREGYRINSNREEFQLDLDLAEDILEELHDSNEMPGSRQRRQSNRSGRALEPASLGIHSPDIPDNSSRPFGEANRTYSNTEEFQLDLDLTEDIAEELHDSNEMPGSWQRSPANRSGRALEPASSAIHSPDIPDNSSRRFREGYRINSNREEFQLDLDLAEDIIEELHDSNEMPGSRQRRQSNRSGRALEPASLGIHSPDIPDNSSRRFREGYRINSNREEFQLDLDLAEDIIEELHDSNEMPGSWQRSPANRSGRALEPASLGIHSPDITDNSSRPFGVAYSIYFNREQRPLDIDLTEDIAEELHDFNELPGSRQRSPANRSGRALEPASSAIHSPDIPDNSSRPFGVAYSIYFNREQRPLDIDLTEDIAEELHDSNELPGSRQRSPANRSGRAIQPASSAIHSPDIPDNSSRRFRETHRINSNREERPLDIHLSEDLQEQPQDSIELLELTNDPAENYSTVENSHRSRASVVRTESPPPLVESLGLEAHESDGPPAEVPDERLSNPRMHDRESAAAASSSDSSVRRHAKDIALWHYVNSLLESLNAELNGETDVRDKINLDCEVLLYMRYKRKLPNQKEIFEALAYTPEQRLYVLSLMKFDLQEILRMNTPEGLNDCTTCNTNHKQNHPDARIRRCTDPVELLRQQLQVSQRLAKYWKERATVYRKRTETNAGQTHRNRHAEMGDFEGPRVNTTPHTRRRGARI